MKLVTLGGLRLGGVDFGRPKPLLLLAYLAIEGPQSRRHLAELFWHDASDPMASLRVALTRLRQAAPQAIRDVDHRLATDVTCDATDLLQSLERASDSEPPVASARAFLDGLYLSNVSTELEEWIYGTREFIAQRIRGALLTHAERLANRSNRDRARAATAAIAALDVAGAGPPDPEDLQRAHPILASARHERARAVADELREYGLEPDTTTVAAEAARHVDKAPTNLTPPTTSFIGRDTELRTIHELLDEGHERLITLLGTAGVGKTRLSIQAAYEALSSGRHPDGVYWVGLDAESDASRIGERIAEALGFTPQGADPVIDQVTRYLTNQRVLLILDNYEQLVEGADIPVRLIHRCPDLSVLVTSRERLNVAEERVLPVRGLPYPNEPITPEDALTYDAVQLFTIRAQRSRPDFRIDEHTLPGVLRVCALVDGAALGLELAAAWTRALPIDEIAHELEASLEGLTALARDVPERHQNLKAAFERSWQLLTEQERTVLRRLAVFRGGFRREGASAVAGATLPLLASLVDKSLLRVSPTGRYDRHPLVHQFSLEKLKADPEELQTYKNRHGTHFWQEIKPPDDAVPSRSSGGRNLHERLSIELSPDALKRAQDELPNLRVAWQHYLDTQDGTKIAAAADFLGTTAELWNRFREGLVLCEDALAALRSDSDERRWARARVEAVLAVMYWRLGRFDEGFALAQGAFDVIRELASLDDGIGHWWATQAAGLNLQHMGRIQESLAFVRLGHDHADRASKTASSSFLRRRLDGLAGLSATICGWCSIFLGDLTQAEAWLMESHDRMYTSEPRGAAYANYPLAYLALVRGDHESAIRWASEGIAHAEKAGQEVVILSILQRWGRALFALDRLDEAEEVLTRAVQKAHLSGDLVDGTPSRALLGRVLVRLDRPSEAAPFLVRSIREARLIGQIAFSLDDALLGVAELAASLDDPLVSRIAAFVAGLDGAQPIAREEAKRLLDQLPAYDDGGPRDLDALVRDVERFAHHFERASTA